MKLLQNIKKYGQIKPDIAAVSEGGGTVNL